MSAPVVPPRAVLVDLDDTLVPWHTVAHWQWAWHPLGPLLAERHALAAIRRSQHAWDRRRWQGLVGTSPPTTAADLREAARAELEAIAGRALPPAESDAVLDRFFRPMGEAETFPDALAFVRAVEGRGAHVAVVTDLPAATARHALRRAGLPEALLALDGDDPEGRLPATAIFRAAARRVGAKPRDCLYVGDLFWSDVRAAGRAGFPAILLDRPDRQPQVTGLRVRSLAEIPARLDAPPAPVEPTAGPAGGP